MALTQISTDGIKNGTITGSDLATNVDLVNNQKLRFGTSNVFEIFHNGNDSQIHNASGDLVIRANSFKIRNQSESEKLLDAFANGAVELYYDNSKKFETDSNGVTVTGQLRFTDDNSIIVRPTSSSLAFNTGGSERLRINSSGHVKLPDTKQLQFGGALNSGDGDLQIYHDGTDSVLLNNTGKLRHRADVHIFKNNANNETLAKFNANGAVELYHDNSKKFDTTSYGVSLTGTLCASGNIKTCTDTGIIAAGASDDLQIYHDGSDSYIKDAGTGQLLILTNEFRLQNAAGNEQQIAANENGAVELYHDGTKRLETTANGVEIANALFVGEKIDMPDHTSGTNGMILLGTGDDLFMYHDGTNSHLRNNTGTFNIRATNFRLTDAAIQHVYLKTNDSGNNDVQLYYDNSKKFETTSAGVSVTGTIESTNHIQITHTSPSLYLTDSNDNPDYVLRNNGGQFIIRDDTSGVTRLAVNTDGHVDITGNLDLPDNTSGNASLRLGNSQDFFMNHNGTDSFIINNTGDLYIRDLNGDVHIQGKDNEEGIIVKADAEVELYYNNGLKFETTSTGVAITGEAALTGGALKLDSHPLVSIANFTDISGGSYAARLGSTGSSTIRSTQIYGGGGHIATFDGVNIRLGIGETSPDFDLHITSSNPGIVLEDSTNSSQHGQAIIEQNGDNLKIRCDAGNASSGTDSNIRLEVDGGERIRVKSDGSFCIGTTGNVTASTGGATFSSASDGRKKLMLGVTVASGRGLVNFFNSNGEVGGINTDGSGTQYLTSSDYRLKENVVPISDGIIRLKTLKPSRFNFIADVNTTVDGFLAHEVTAVPEAITGTKDELVTQSLIDSGDKDQSELGNPVYQSIDQSKLVPLVVAALQEAIGKIEILETEVAALKAA